MRRLYSQEDLLESNSKNKHENRWEYDKSTWRDAMKKIKYL